MALTLILEAEWVLRAEDGTEGRLITLEFPHFEADGARRKNGGKENRGIHLVGCCCLSILRYFFVAFVVVYHTPLSIISTSLITRTLACLIRS